MVTQQASKAPLKDIGVPDFAWGQWGQGLMSDWFESSPELIWPLSVTTYGRMRHDPQIKGVLGAYLYPLLRANWALDPEGCRDEVVQHCADDLGLPILGTDKKQTGARRRGVIWKRHLRQLLGYQIFGYSVFERRYRFDAKKPDLLRLDNLGQRMPWTLATIDLNRDATVKQITQTTQGTPIPARRLVWYVADQEGANWAGISPLRACYGAWLLKHETWRVHATSIRRFGMGVPEVKAPVGATAGQVQQAQQLASAIRAGSTAGVGLPNGFEYNLKGLVGSVPDALAFIKYLDGAMAKQALAGLMDLGSTDHGSRALGETFLDLFMLCLKSLADEVSLIATSGWPEMPGIVTDLVDMNWGEDEPAPQIVCTDLGADYEVTEDAINRLVQFGAIDPDPNLEAWLRKRWGLPERKEEAPPENPPPTPPAGPQPTPANEDNPAPAPAPAPAKPAPAKAAPAKPAPAKAAGPKTLLRRALSPVEAAAGFDPLVVHQEWKDARTALVTAYKSQALGPIRDALVDQVAADVQAGRLDRLAGLTADMGAAVDLVSAAMRSMAQTAAERMRAEAAQQGVTIPAGDVHLDEGKLDQLAAARCSLVGAYLTQQASRRALQIAAAGPPPKPKADLSGMPEMPADVVAAMQAFLDSLSDTSLDDEFGAALTAAQNEGRMSVLEAAPESAGTAEYTASEIEDGNTCEPCRGIDGTVFGTLTEAEGAYPSGGYIDCLSMLRCRGTVIARWGGF